MNKKNMDILLNQKGEINELQFAGQVRKILKSPYRPYEKKLALFNLVKDLELEESPEEKEKNNYLLESYLFTEFAKRSMKEYKKVKTENFHK